MTLRLLILSVCIGTASGFLCYACSWGGTDTEREDAHPACLDQVEQLPLSSHIKCGNFCVTSEQFDLQKKQVVSFFRTCSVDWGNQCSGDTWWITCKTSCEGNFCNANVKIDLNDKTPPTVFDPFFGSKGSGSILNDASHTDNGCLKVYLFVMLWFLYNEFT